MIRRPFWSVNDEENQEEDEQEKENSSLFVAMPQSSPSCSVLSEARIRCLKTNTNTIVKEVQASMPLT